LIVFAWPPLCFSAIRARFFRGGLLKCRRFWSMARPSSWSSRISIFAPFLLHATTSFASLLFPPHPPVRSFLRLQSPSGALVFSWARSSIPQFSGHFQPGGSHHPVLSPLVESERFDPPLFPHLSAARTCLWAACW